MVTPGQPSYEELTALVAAQAQLITEQAATIEGLRAEIVALKRLLERDSTTSSQPPSKDTPAAKAKAKNKARSATAQAGRKRAQGGQPGHRGSGLARVMVPDAVRTLEPAACVRCGAGLAGAAGTPGRISSSIQVFDLPTIKVQVTEYLMMARTCVCGHESTAAAPAGVRGGPTCYGPNIAAAATLLASCDVVGIERTAQLMSDLIDVTVSTGFVSSCLQRLDDALTRQGFEDALKAALTSADVLGADETPAALTTAATDVKDCHNPHVFTVRTLHAYTRAASDQTATNGDLVWFGAAGTRTKACLSDFNILEDYAGVLVRDDFGGYTSYDRQLAGVQQCLAHIIRYLDDTYAINTTDQAWTRQVLDVLREAIHAVKTARDKGEACLKTEYLEALQARYDQAVAVGISTNLSRPWNRGNHPGLQLARRLRRKKSQIWLFTTRFDVPPTNNGSEHAVRGVKLFVKVKGCWRTLATLRRHCRIRSYLTTTRNHGIHATDAIRDALTGICWMPPAPA